jgi:hypothetical protein
VNPGATHDGDLRQAVGGDSAEIVRNIRAGLATGGRR